MRPGYTAGGRSTVVRQRPAVDRQWTGNRQLRRVPLRGETTCRSATHRQSTTAPPDAASPALATGGGYLTSAEGTMDLRGDPAGMVEGRRSRSANRAASCA